MADSKLFPVSKNGKFFGYADAGQIARNKSLEIFDESKARNIEDQKVIDAQKAEDQKSAEQRAALEGQSASPDDVKKKDPAKK